MRATVALTALLVLSSLAGLAAADRGGDEPDDTGDGGQEPPQTGNGSKRPGSPTSAPPRPKDCSQEPDAEAQKRCMQRLCREQPEAPRCQAMVCKREGKDGCAEAEAFLAERRHAVAFDILPDRSGLANYTVGGVLAIRELRIEPMADAEMSRHGSVLRVRADETRLEIHDEPGGLLRFRGGNETLITLAFPADARVEADGPGYRVSYAGGARALLVAAPGNATVDGSTLSARGFLSFHLAPPKEAAGGAAPTATPEQRRHLGAEISLRRPAAGEEPVQVLAYDDLEVEVSMPEGASRTVRLELDANVTEGRTVAIDVDAAVLETSDPERIVMRYFDVHEDGAETEVVFKRAGSLADVLDPTDDGGQPEYWIVSDGDGHHILVSVPHWSIHAVTVQGLGELVQPSVLVGVVAAGAGIALATVLMFAPRRRRD